MELFLLFVDLPRDDDINASELWYLETYAELDTATGVVFIVIAVSRLCSHQKPGLYRLQHT